MSFSSGQLLLDFPPDDLSTFDDFIPSDANRVALEAVRAVRAQEAASLTLWGEAGCGKSHLLRAAVQREGGRYLDLAAWAEKPINSKEAASADWAAKLGNLNLAAADGLEELEGRGDLQEGLFHLFNRLKENGGKLLAASRTPVPELEWMLPDLRSRLLWGPVMELPPLGEAELESLLYKLAEERRVVLPEVVIRFLVLRLPPRVPAYQAAFDQLDRAALAEKRPLTVALAKRVLEL